MDGEPRRIPEFEEALNKLPRGLEPLAVLTRLRATLPAEIAREAAELHQLRLRAEPKLAGAAGLHLTRKGLEQASDWRVARARAGRIADWAEQEREVPWILDGTAGIGGDSMALAAAGVRRLVCIERDATTAGMLRANLLIRGGAARVLSGRVETGIVRAAGIVLDPDRRPAPGRRSGNPDLWVPDWASCVSLLLAHRAGCVKLAPAVDVERLALPSRIPRAWQWVSLGGELKEVTLWTGAWAPATEMPGALLAGNGQRNVLILAKDGSVRAAWGSAPCKTPHLEPVEAAHCEWIAEPDPTLIRSGLVGALAAVEGLRPLGPGIAYLGGHEPPSRPLSTGYRVLGHCPVDRRRIRRLLAEHDVGPLTVKKRGHPNTAEELARRFRGRGSKHGVLLVTRLAAGHHAFLVRASPPLTRTRQETRDYPPPA